MLFQNRSKNLNIVCYAISGFTLHLDILKNVLGIDFKMLKEVIYLRHRIVTAVTLNVLVSACVGRGWMGARKRENTRDSSQEYN